MVVLLSFVGCGGADPAPLPMPDPGRPALVCPGDADCADNTGPLRAGAAVRSIVPRCFEHWEDLNGDATYDRIGEQFYDCGCDALCAGDPGYPGPDEGEGDEVFQAVWLAGFQNSRPANGVRNASLGLRGEGDGLYATVVVLDQGSTRVAIAALDAFGLMIDDALAIREAATAAGLGIDHLVVHSSHTHASPDVLGIYGQSIGQSGYDPRYVNEIQAAVLDALRESVDELVPVSLEVGAVDAGAYHNDGVGNLIVDTRDPVIIDPMVSVARFIADDDATVATLVHFGNHPEETAGEWALLTANFVHALRQTVSDGVDWGQGARPGVGGVAIYLNGTVGGMMTSLRAAVEDPNGVIPADRTFEKADTIGQILGGMALDAVAKAVRAQAPTLSARRNTLFIPVHNDAFRAMFAIGTLSHRQIYNVDESQALSPTNTPDVQTEVGLIGLGPLELLCVPGEWFPELVLGGYDGSFTPSNQDLVDPDNDNPPDMFNVEAGPYLRERLSAPNRWVVGLANDQLGYVIPPAHFELGIVPYLIEADGDHYEETNSLGPQTAPRLLEAALALIGYQPG